MSLPSSPARSSSARPQLTSGMRSNSYLQEFQQYRPPTKQYDNLNGIDTVVEGINNASINPPITITPFAGVPSPEHPPHVIESGLRHDLSHPNCTPAPGKKTARLVATLFYKASTPRISNAVSPSQSTFPRRPSGATAAGSPPPPLSTSTSNLTALSDSTTDLPANLAPTTDLAEYPLEPPTAEPEPLDHLYGSYISPLCITSFLQLMLSSFHHGSNPDDLSTTHRCLDDPTHPYIVELTLPLPDPTYLPIADLRKHELIYRFEREWNVDVALQHDTLWRRYPRLVVFDMDSTLITQEVIDLLAATVTNPPDLGARVADITHRAMAGELQFESAFRERMALLKGVDGTVFDQLRTVLDVTNGVKPLIKALKRLGVRTAVLSGGFQPLTSWLASQLGLDHAYANNVVIDSSTGKLTGEVNGIIVGRERKCELLKEIAQKENIDVAQVVAVGDGANDLDMMAAAGLGVAWNAKPRVQMEADARLNGESMLDLLYLFGFTRDEVEALSA